MSAKVESARKQFAAALASVPSDHEIEKDTQGNWVIRDNYLADRHTFRALVDGMKDACHMAKNGTRVEPDTDTLRLAFTHAAGDYGVAYFTLYELFLALEERRMAKIVVRA